MHLRIIGTSIVLCLAIWCCGFSVRPSTEAAQPEQPAGAGQASKFEFKGALECSNCHTSPSPKYKAEGVTNFVELTEFAKWFRDDKHSRAYLLIIPDREHFDRALAQFQLLQKALEGIQVPANKVEWGASNKLSADICQRLGIDVKKFDQARACLSCHANWRAQDKALDHDVQKFSVGVGCEACHGASSEWWKSDNHQQPAWRKRDPVEKFRDFGMIDVRNPTARARQCFSCHIGNVDEGKVVTHEMYAAGHPPLPSIEIESFAEQMPRHWRYLSEKPDFNFRQEFLQQNLPQLAELKDEDKYNSTSVFYRTQAVTLGGVFAMREWTSTFANQAGNSSNWPEYAAFDCGACHHELKVPSWRQERGYIGKPGRPITPYWPMALVNLGIFQVSVNRAAYDVRVNALSDELAELRAAISARPFGDAGKIQIASTKLIASLDALAAELAASRFDSDAAKKSLRFLCQPPQDKYLDRDSARQIAWAIEVIYAELNPKPSAAAEIEKVLAELRAQLLLQLPSGPDQQITAAMPGSLSNIAGFKPADFAAKLQSLSALLPKP